jgi:hypothetical protein
MPDQEAARLMHNATIVVLPYISASQSGVAALALAFGRPIIASAVGGLNEMVIHGKTGLLVPPGNVAALASHQVWRRTEGALPCGVRQFNSELPGNCVLWRKPKEDAGARSAQSRATQWQALYLSVIGSYNAEAWIRQTLDSVLAQTYGVSEILVIDDGSSDATPAIVRSYGGVVSLLLEPHRGRPHRNRGILDSSGEFIAFVDADDLWQPNKLEKQLVMLLAQNVNWVVCDSQWLDAETGRLGSLR